MITKTTFQATDGSNQVLDIYRSMKGIAIHDLTGPIYISIVADTVVNEVSLAAALATIA